MKPVSFFSSRGALVNRVNRSVRSSRLNSSPVRSIDLPVRHPGMCRSHDSDSEFRPVLGGCDAGLMIPRFPATCGYPRKLKSVFCNPRHRGDPPQGRERQRACARRGAARHNSLEAAPSPPLPGKRRTARWPSSCARPASRARRPAPGGSGTATASRRVRAGVPLPTIAAVFGSAALTTPAIYTPAIGAEARELVSRVWT